MILKQQVGAIFAFVDGYEIAALPWSPQQEVEGDLVADIQVGMSDDVAAGKWYLCYHSPEHTFATAGVAHIY